MWAIVFQPSVQKKREVRAILCSGEKHIQLSQGPLTSPHWEQFLLSHVPHTGGDEMKRSKDAVPAFLHGNPVDCKEGKQLLGKPQPAHFCGEFEALLNSFASTLTAHGIHVVCHLATSVLELHFPAVPDLLPAY